MSYVDGFVIPVPKKKIKDYRKLATLASKIWRDHGALQYFECIADDVKKGKWTSFPRAVKLKPSETVVFSWITYKSRAARDRVNAKVMADQKTRAALDWSRIQTCASCPDCNASRAASTASSSACSLSR